MQVVKEEVPPAANKYTVRPPKDLRSKYELKMEERRMKQLADEEDELRKAEAERLRVRLGFTSLFCVCVCYRCVKSLLRYGALRAA